MLSTMYVHVHKTDILFGTQFNAFITAEKKFRGIHMIEVNHS